MFLVKCHYSGKSVKAKFHVLVRRLFFHPFLSRQMDVPGNYGPNRNLGQIILNDFRGRMFSGIAHLIVNLGLVHRFSGFDLGCDQYRRGNHESGN